MYSVKPVFFSLVLLCNALLIPAGWMKLRGMTETRYESLPTHSSYYHPNFYVSQSVSSWLRCPFWNGLMFWGPSSPAPAWPGHMHSFSPLWCPCWPWPCWVEARWALDINWCLNALWVFVTAHCNDHCTHSLQRILLLLVWYIWMLFLII